MNHFVHPQALCESDDIGEGTRVWAFAHVLPGARIGADGNICDHVFIENDVVLGDRVTIKCGVQLWDGTRVGDDVFIGPNASFANDRFPRSKQYPQEFLTTTIGDGASIGSGAVILPGIKIGRGAMVGAGAVVTRNVPANAVVVGNPARITGYAGAEESPRDDSPTTQDGASPTGDPLLRPVTVARDLRGSLAAVEFGDDLPFVPRRFFAVLDVPTRDVRGEHAHKACEQFLVALRGSVTCVVDDGRSRRTVVLDRPDVGLYMPAMTWGTQYRYTEDAVLGVFASLPYDSDDYVREYDAFLALVADEDAAART